MILRNVRHLNFSHIQFSPVITPHARSFVHHVIIYQCTSPISESLVGESVPCDQSSQDIANCRARGGFLVAVWAVGGEVSLLQSAPTRGENWWRKCISSP